MGNSGAAQMTANGITETSKRLAGETETIVAEFDETLPGEGALAIEGAVGAGFVAMDDVVPRVSETGAEV